MSLFGIRNLAPYLLSDMSCSDGLKVYPSSLWVDYMNERNEKNEFYTFIEITLIWHKKYTKKTTKRHYHDNIKYRDILTHDNRCQLFLILPIPRVQHSQQ